MRILMTTDTVGGVWNYCVQLARALAPLDVEIALAIQGIPSAEQLAVASSVPNIEFTYQPYKLEWMDDPWQDVAAAGRWLQDLAHAYQPDVIHLNDYCHAALRWNAPVVVVGHSCVLSWLAAVRGNKPTLQQREYQDRVRRGLQAAEMVVAPTRAMLNALNGFYGPLGRQRVIPNGSDASLFSQGHKKPFVFSAGRFWDEAKNLEALETAAPDISWPVRVAGLRHPDGYDGNFAAVEPLGSLTSRQIAQTYSEASIYAIPALYEPFGLTPLEAALSGCALVLGDIPTLREVWGEAASYVPPRVPRQLARTINRLIEDDSSRKRMAKLAYRRGQQFTARRMADAYLKCYRCLSGKLVAAQTATRNRANLVEAR